MSELFHWAIFLLHLAAALVLTFGVWFRCDPDLWVSRMHVDAYAPVAGGYGLWWDVENRTRAALCAASPDLGCYLEDLPLYEGPASGLGWHLFGLLGHFEWISAAFAFFYIEGRWGRQSWAISAAMAIAGTLLYLPWHVQRVFANEVLLLLVNGAASAAVFYGHRHVHQRLADADAAGAPSAPEFPPPPQEEARAGFRIPLGWLRAPRLRGPGTLETGSLRLATLPALRFAEYCITASELFVAVLSLFVADAPAFMTIGGYALILLCNLYGGLLHYSLVADHASPVAELRQSGWKGMTIPRAWLRPEYAGPGPAPPPATVPEVHGWGWSEQFLSRRYAWGSYIASNTATLLNSWLAFALALALVLYQQTFLFSGDPPWFVVMSGWSLLVMYTLFGLWVSAVYTYPAYWASALGGWGGGLEETYLLTVRGLDVLSVVAKLSVVSMLSFGFVFSADGRCG
jgi:hypothetical protein